MTNNPTFVPGQTVWSTQMGKGVVYKPTPDMPEIVCVDFGDFYEEFTFDGKCNPRHRYRTLFTLSEAAQYGWLPKEPLRVEFVTYPTRPLNTQEVVGSITNEHLASFVGKRVHVTVKKIPE